jgi:hypothetical protein
MSDLKQYSKENENVEVGDMIYYVLMNEWEFFDLLLSLSTKSTNTSTRCYIKTKKKD